MSPFISSIIFQASPAYGVYISQLGNKILCTEQWFSGQSSAADTKATQTRLRCSQVEVITTNNLLSSSQSGWPLRNIHISNDNGSFTFCVDVFFPLSLPKLFTGLIYHRHSNSGPPFFLIWFLLRLWYGSLSGSISLNHLSIFYNCQNTKRESSLRLDILQ